VGQIVLRQVSQTHPGGGRGAGALNLETGGSGCAGGRPGRPYFFDTESGRAIGAE